MIDSERAGSADAGDNIASPMDDGTQPAPGSMTICRQHCLPDQNAYFTPACKVRGMPTWMPRVRSTM